MNLDSSVFAKPALVGFMLGGLSLPTMTPGVGTRAFSVMQRDFDDGKLLELPNYRVSQVIGTDIGASLYFVHVNTAFETPNDIGSVEAEISYAASVVNVLEKIKRRSGLTGDQVAPLLGVSRRSLQFWKSGREISASNENRVRAVSEVLEKFPSAAGKATKDLLLTRTPGYVRIYDLLAEGKYELALLRANQSRELEPIRVDKSLKIEHLPIDVLLSRSDEVGNSTSGKLDRRYSRRLKV